ncbi:Repeat domain in Vibrio, Colwellia, Bradyrhizobium and Shewanella [uncultured archaeon]|nr:Repeat domain in Vibrio, Colwellia, Bradyrhizobium and Shewanella [uncultured archaeon]
MHLHRHIPIAIILALAIAHTASAQSSTSSFEKALTLEWYYQANGTATGLGAVDVNGDGPPEIAASYDSSDIIILDRYGHYKTNYSVGEVKDVGRIYDLKVVDVNGDGKNEIIAALGALRYKVKYNLNQFKNVDNRTVELIRKSLYEIDHNLGGITVLKPTGEILWHVQTEQSVNAISTSDVYHTQEQHLLAALGAFQKDTYNEYKGVDINGTEIWNLTDYVLQNGSFELYDSKGTLNTSRYIYLVDQNKYLIEGANNNVRSVLAADINGDGVAEFLAGTEAGTLYAYNNSNGFTWSQAVGGSVRVLSAADLTKDDGQEIVAGTSNGQLALFTSKGKLIWQTRLPGVISSLTIQDIDGNEITDIVVGCGDGYIYVYDGLGNLAWKFYTGSPIHRLITGDFNENGYADIIIATKGNITMYEVNNLYVQREQANTFYDKAIEYSNAQDYVVALIYAQRARSIYERIGLTENLPKTDILIKSITEDLKSEKKLSGEYNYEHALNYFSQNDYRTSQTYAQRALSIFTEIGDTDGQNKVNRLLSQIDDELRLFRKTEADGLYSRALSYNSFSNYSGAVILSRKARDIYDEINETNGSITCNALIGQIGDTFYLKALQNYNLTDYQTALFYANQSYSLYVEVQYWPQSGKAEALMKDIVAAMNKPQVQEQPSKLPLVAVAVIAVVVILAVVKTRKRSSKPVM